MSGMVVIDYLDFSYLINGYYVAAVFYYKLYCKSILYRHKCFKCWCLALPEKKTITKPLINSYFNLGLPEGPRYPVLTIIKELLRQFES